MVKMNGSRLVVTLFLCIAGLVASAGAQHPAITLLDREYDEINPITGENAAAPLSTAATCGSCHDYEEITSGYHFQMGWDVVDDDFGVAEGKPWQISNGMMGKWCPMYLRQLAKKENETVEQIDLTVYDFVGFSAGERGIIGPELEDTDDDSDNSDESDQPTEA